MSETTEPTLAERLREAIDAIEAKHAATNRCANASQIAMNAWGNNYGASEPNFRAYLRGYDDARAECAAEIEENGALKRRVQELEAQIEKARDFALERVRRAHKLAVQCATLKQANDDLARKSLAQHEVQPATAVGVVGEVGWAVQNGNGCCIPYLNREMAENEIRKHAPNARIRAIVDPEQIVSLSQRERVRALPVSHIKALDAAHRDDFVRIMYANDVRAAVEGTA